MPPISTRHLKSMPGIDRLRSLLQSLAVLELILSPEWESRYYSFDANWSRHEQMGSMRNGSGDEFFALFNPAGCFIKGFDHESEMTPYRVDPPQIWPGLLEGVPDAFSSGLNEPAFSMENVTVCIWRQNEDSNWSHGPIEFPKGEDPDGSERLFEILNGEPEDYQAFAQDYYEVDVSLKAIRHVYDQLPLTEKVVHALNSDVTLKMISRDLKSTGYAGVRKK